MSNLSVKNKVKLINSKFVGGPRGFNNLPQYQPLPLSLSNNLIPENLYVSPPNSPTGVNNSASVASNIGSVSSLAPYTEAPTVDPTVAPIEDVVNEYIPVVQHNYNANIAAWKNRNTLKNKKYKTRANDNAANQAKLRAQLAQASLHSLAYNNGEEHSSQYWQNKRAANTAVVKPVVKTVSKWAPVKTGTFRRRNRKSRRNGRK